MSSDTYRIVVRSANRLSGHVHDFLYDVSSVTTARDFVGTTWMVGLEWCDTISYSEYEPDFAANVNHPSCLLLECPTLQQLNSYESWSGNPSSTMAILQSFASTGKYGVVADSPYLCRDSLAVVVQGDRLNQLGHLRIRVSQGPSINDGGVVACEEPGVDVYSGGDFSFSLVFWRVDNLAPEKPIVAHYDVYKLYLASIDRISGTPADCVIPIHARSTGMEHGKWEVAVDGWSQLKHESQSLSNEWSLVSNTFADANSNSVVIGRFARARVDGATNEYGLRLSTKPPTRGTIGVPVNTKLDTLQTVHLAIKDSATMDAVDDPFFVEDWLICLVFYRVQ